MTSQGSAHGRFQRAIQRRNLFQTELAMRELGTPSLLELLPTSICWRKFGPRSWSAQPFAGTAVWKPKRKR
jgi:hypothetical protein